MTKLEGTINLPEKRDNDWLVDRLAEVWYRSFSDVPQLNEIIITFGRKSKTRLGSIGMPGWQDKGRQATYTGHRGVTKGVTVITITGYFRDPGVPEYVVDSTIAHELAHYAHGFHSPLPQLYTHPHRGGVIDQELEKRGLDEMVKKQQRWFKDEWIAIVGPPKRRQRKQYRRLSFLSAFS